VQSEIFRFMAIRPPQAVNSRRERKNTVNLNYSTSEWIGSLVKQKKAESRAGIENLVQNFLKSNTAAFIDSRKKLESQFETKIITFYEAVLGLDEKEFLTHAKILFVNILDSEPQEIINSEGFRQLSIKVTHSKLLQQLTKTSKLRCEVY
jgi:hypothetical protein